MFDFRRKAPGGKRISTARGERLAAWVRRRPERRFAFGVLFRAVSFADSRSGWSAVVMDVMLGWWCRSYTVLKWVNPPRREYRVLSLAEQIRRDHGPTLEEQERKEAEEEADEKARLALLDKMIKEHDARNAGRV